MINKQIFKNLDVILSFLLILISILLIALNGLINKPVYVLLGFFMIFTGMMWLYSRNKVILKFDSDYINYVVLNILFFICLLFSILVLYFRPDNYMRPLSYFILISFMAGIIALEIFFSPSKKFNMLILLQIVTIGLSVSLSQLFLFPTIIGIDPWWHQMFTMNIMESHHIPTGGYPYEKIPIFHLLITNTSFITGLSYKLSSIISITFPLILVGTLITYNTGKYLINDKIGLLGALILVLSNYFINGEIWAIPTTLGGIFLITIIYLLLNFRNRKNVIVPIIVVLLMFTLLLTHTIVSLIMAILLITGWISYFIYKKVYKKSGNYFPLTLGIYFTVTMLCWWMYASNTLTDIVEMVGWGLKVDPSLSETPLKVLTYISTINLDQQIFINLGTFIIFSLSIFGFFFLISKRYTNEKKFLYGFIAIIPLLISFLTIISGYSIIQARWLFISEILLAVPAAITVSTLSNHFSNKKLKVILLFGTVFILSFFMIMDSNVSNIDNNEFYHDGAVRYAFTTSELTAFKSINSLNTTYTTDHYYLSLNPTSLIDGSNIETISNGIYNKNITNTTNSMILIRNEVEKKPFILFGSIYKINFNIEDLLEKNGYSVLYDSGSVKGYLKNNNT